MITSMRNLPLNHHARSKFNIPDSWQGTWNLGELHMLECRPVLPGDTFKVTESKVVRTQPMVAPIMDDLEFNTYHFFVRWADLWENFKYFCGESKGKWRDEDAEYILPKIQSPEGGFEFGTLASDLGIRPGKEITVNGMPFRAYAKIINDWFRNTVTEDEIYVPMGDSTVQAAKKADYDYVNGPHKGLLYTVNRNFDIFSLASIEPQRGPQVTINVAGDIPVFGNGVGLGITDGNNFASLAKPSTLNGNPLIASYQKFGSEIGSSGSYVGNVLENDKTIGVVTKEQLSSPLDYSYTGLIASLNDTSIISINELRNAFAVQRYYEQMSLFGNRYEDIIKALFSVDIPDATLHKAEYLGGRSVPIQIFQNVQSSETGNITPQGNVVGYSVTGDSDYVFEKSFTEYGYYIVLGCAKIKTHRYSQGLTKHLSYETFFDLYNPLFDSLGDDKILNKQIFLQDDDEVNEETGIAYNEEVFGYNERFYDYRYPTRIVTGELNPEYTTPLPWNLADKYDSLPTLTEAWQKEDKALLDRVLAVTSSQADQFWGDFKFDITAIRPMSLHSVPGAVIR